MKKNLFFALAIAGLSLTSCSNGNGGETDTTSVAKEVVDTIPYRFLKGYELKKGVEELHTVKFGSSKVFNQYFDAKSDADKVDFNSEFVIAAVEPKAEGVLVFDAINKASGDRLLMTYSVEESQDKSASKILLVAVPDSIGGYVDVKKLM